MTTLDAGEDYPGVCEQLGQPGPRGRSLKAAQRRGELRAAKLGNGKNAELFVRRADFDKAFEKKLAA